MSSYQHAEVLEVVKLLKDRFAQLANKADILKAPELRALYAQLSQLPADQRGSFGKEES